MIGPLGRLVLVGMFLHGTALASEPPDTSSETSRPMRAGAIAKGARKASVETRVDVAAAPVASTDAGASTTGPDPDAPALESDQPAEVEDPAVQLTTEEGVWTWVARMEGEIPDPEVVRATEELLEETRAEYALIDDLNGPSVPLTFYQDPAASLAGDPLYLDLVDPSEFDIPIVVNPEVEKWVRYFTGDGRKYFARWLARSTRYRPMMYERLDAKGLPRDLVYLSMIESGYNAHAYSSAAAVGLWQFIQSTGRVYDLRIDWWIDDRRDPERSTDAALAFLADLHKMFGDWELAWASYNGGPGRVRRSISSSGSKDFWTIAAGTWLHSETRNYVPKIMAAAIIGKHPERYGFTDIAYQDELVYDTAEVDGMVEITALARCAGVDEDTFRVLNPALRRWATPEGVTEVRVPAGRKDTFVAALGKLPAYERVAFVRHKVQRGETLSGIASRYNVSVAEMSRVNKLGNADRIFVGMSLVIPSGGMGELVEAARVVSDAPAPKAAPSATRTRSHTVRSGDTLSGIAAKYAVSVADLRAWNRVKGDTIYVGQTLTLQGGSASASASTSSSVSNVRHTVARGESLSGIASRYGVPTAELQRWNDITDPSRILVGQVLTVRVPEARTTTHTVVAGESLGAIARRYGCSVDEIVGWNKLSSTVIHPGQALKIRR